MKLSVNIGDLHDALVQVTPTIDKRGGVASNVYIKAVKNDKDGLIYLLSTNFVATTLTRVPAKVEVEGQALLEPKKIRDGLLGADRTKDVAIELDGTKIKFKTGRTRFNQGVLAGVENMAAISKTMSLKGKESSFSIGSNTLSDIYRKTSFCIPSDESGQRQDLAGIKMSFKDKKLEIQATDGIIASILELDAAQSPKDTSLMIPIQSVECASSLLRKNKDVDIDIYVPEAKNFVSFKLEDTLYMSRLNVKVFPDIRPLVDINKGKFKVSVNRQDFASAISRAVAFLEDSKVIVLELSGKQIDIKTRGSSQSEISDTVDIVFEGEKPTEVIKIGINARTLADTLSSTKSKDVTMEITGPLKPVMITDKENDIVSKYVIAPTRM